jgi:pimeloyl-ACP methyl ester carboxylesterase
VPARLFIATALAAAIAAVPAALAADPPDPLHDSLVYCRQTFDGGATGTGTDAEHTIEVGDPPLPPRVRQRRLKVGGITTRVTEAGPATATEAAVFVHGNPGSARDYDALVAAAGRHGRAVAFDVPGMGHADDRPGGPYSVDGAAAFIERVRARLGIERVHMVLHDFGGPWGLQWAVRHPDRLASVVLIDTGVFIGYYGHPTALEYHTPLVGEVNMATTTRESFTAFLQANNPKPLPGRFVDRMYDDYDRGTRCAALSYYRSIDNPDAMGKAQAKVLRRRRRPALVFWGKKDPYVPVSLARTQRQAFPGARIVVLPKAGHWPFVDEPATARSVIVPFLRRVVRAPRFVVYHGKLHAGRTRPWHADLGVRRARGAHRVRLRLRRRGKLVGGTRRAVAVGRGLRRVTIRLRRPLRAGRYALRITSAELPAQRVRVRVRR